MLTDYIKATMMRAEYEFIQEDGKYFGHVPEIEGAWSYGKKLESCRDELEQAIEDWLIFSIRRDLPIPVLDGLDLNTKRELAEIETHQQTYA